MATFTSHSSLAGLDAANRAPVSRAAAGPVRRLVSALTATNADATQLVARVTAGAVLIPHGLQHLVGAWGGPGLQGTTAFFTQYLGLPYVTVPFVIGTEVIGGALLIAGLFSRVAALALAGMMIGATVSVHLPHGFFMNWFGTQKGEGYEYHLLAIGIALALIISGAGMWSRDAALAR
jgi:putative oxidoreductase